MQFSRPLKSSAHSLPSPDGKLIASLINTKLTIRTTRSLETHRTFALPKRFSSNITTFIWSPSSSRLLLASSDGTIRILAVAGDDKFSASISNPTSETTKPSHIAFGAGENEILVISEYGLKLSIFKLETRTNIDIPAPKLFGANTAKDGYALRPNTRHLALLTRHQGKDMVSIHKRRSYEVVRSWITETVDAQSICWSPDGNWLLVVDSAAHGHRIEVYTSDGHIFKIWKGPKPQGIEEADLEHGAGVKLVEWTKDGRHLVVGDYTDSITVLSVPSFTENMRLRHAMTLYPAESLDVWQEQVLSRAQAALSGQLQRSYTKITSITAPPVASVSPKSSSTDLAIKSGTVSVAIDASGTLIASRRESLPSTVFVWDTASKILKAVLIQNAPIAKITWHPTINELLLIRCEGDDCKGIAYLWEPSYEVPKIVDFSTQLPEGKMIGKTIIRWLATENDGVPAVFFSDTQDAILGAVTDDTDDDVPWNEAKAKAVDIYGQQEESPLNILDAPYEGDSVRGEEDDRGDEPTMDFSEGDSGEMDDTFQFKKTGRT